jgi:hypothetical protein
MTKATFACVVLVLGLLPAAGFARDRVTVQERVTVEEPEPRNPLTQLFDSLFGPPTGTTGQSSGPVEPTAPARGELIREKSCVRYASGKVSCEERR